MSSMTVSAGADAVDNVEVIRSAMTALNTHDTDRLLAVVAPDMIIHYAELAEPLRGRDTWLQGFEIMRSAFPDFRVDIDDIVAAGDRVALRARISGTHTGEFQGAPPTGHHVGYVSHEFYRLSGGVVAEEWICSDMASLFAQVR